MSDRNNPDALATGPTRRQAILGVAIRGATAVARIVIRLRDVARAVGFGDRAEPGDLVIERAAVVIRPSGILIGRCGEIARAIVCRDSRDNVHGIRRIVRGSGLVRRFVGYGGAPALRITDGRQEIHAARIVVGPRRIVIGALKIRVARNDIR